MSQFTDIVEAVMRNKEGCELDRVEVKPDEWFYYQVPPRWAQELSIGDTITIETRQTEVD